MTTALCEPFCVLKCKIQRHIDLFSFYISFLSSLIFVLNAIKAQIRNYRNTRNTHIRIIFRGIYYTYIIYIFQISKLVSMYESNSSASQNFNNTKKYYIILYSAFAIYFIYIENGEKIYLCFFLNIWFGSFKCCR